MIVSAATDHVYVPILRLHRAHSLRLLKTLNTLRPDIFNRTQSRFIYEQFSHVAINALIQLIRTHS